MISVTYSKIIFRNQHHFWETWWCKDSRCVFKVNMNKNAPLKKNEISQWLYRISSSYILLFLLFLWWACFCCWETGCVILEALESSCFLSSPQHRHSSMQVLSIKSEFFAYIQARQWHAAWHMLCLSLDVTNKFLIVCTVHLCCIEVCWCN